MRVKLTSSIIEKGNRPAINVSRMSLRELHKKTLQRNRIAELS